jgi:hypothetical protein
MPYCSAKNYMGLFGTPSLKLKAIREIKSAASHRLSTLIFKSVFGGWVMGIRKIF